MTYCKRIEIMGCMASGKTSLCKTLQKFGWNVCFEQYDDNPFIKKFYQNSCNSFENQMFFLLQHYSSIKENDSPGKILICDYSFLLDSIYASILLSAEEYKMHNMLRMFLAEKIGNPDCIIKLIAPENVIIQRIMNRGRSFEKNIDIGFIRNLNNQITHFSEYKNLYTFDSSKINLLNENEVYFKILKKIIA